MTVRQAAAQLEVSPSLVYALVARGRIRHYRIGNGRGAIRIPDDAIGEFLKGAEVSPPPPRRPSGFRHVRLP
jgi:excisionase family DNA binding protein